MRDIYSTFLYRWFNEVWNNGNENLIDELMAQDAVTHGLTDGKGSEGFREFYKNFKTQFSNFEITVEDVIMQDEMEVARCRVSAIETATGKPVEFSGTSMAHIKDGKIAEAWNHYDFLSMYQQLGQSLKPADNIY